MSGYWTGAPGVRTFFIFVVAGVLLSGCRTYGGHGNEAATYEQIREAHELFQDDLARRQADLRKLEQAAAGDGHLSSAAVQYAQIVQGQEAIVSEQAEKIAALSPDGDYRHLHRVFGAVVSQRNTIRTQYAGLLERLVRAQEQTDTTGAAVEAERPYALVPPFYQRVEGRLRDRSIDELLAQRRSGAGSALEADLGAPEPSTGEPSSDAAAGSSSPGASSGASSADTPPERLSPEGSAGESAPDDAAGREPEQ